MKTTLNKIKEFYPCGSGWKKLLLSLNKTSPDDDELDLMFILKSNGIDDAIWALRCFDYLDYCLFLADIAESVLHIFEKNNTSKEPRNAISGIRDFKGGKITKEELTKLADAAYAAAYAAYADAAYAAYAAADAAADAAYAAAYAAYADAAYAAYAAADAADKKEEVKELFIKHFG